LFLQEKRNNLLKRERLASLFLILVFLEKLFLYLREKVTKRGKAGSARAWSLAYCKLLLYIIIAKRRGQLDLLCGLALMAARGTRPASR
jgi:hypothetical protein